ncbi:hypothetical protein SK128_008854 [Halocaridina rubra]|uniref:Uncharacterized protein n=1 Tax=Halocaridina rubra TaxID=373956 RepID=A0AAN9AFD3_HALRR
MFPRCTLLIIPRQLVRETSRLSDNDGIGQGLLLPNVIMGMRSKHTGLHNGETDKGTLPSNMVSKMISSNL